MSELKDALSRMLWRYERAKEFNQTDSGKEQIERDAKLIIDSYAQMQELTLELLFLSVVGNYDNPTFELVDMPIEIRLIWIHYQKWIDYGLSKYDALDAAITDGCPLQYFEKLDWNEKNKETWK